MTKNERKKKAIDHLRNAEENLRDSDAEYTSNNDIEANYHMTRCIGESLMAIAYLLAMREDMYVYGDRLLERR